MTPVMHKAQCHVINPVFVIFCGIFTAYLDKSFTGIVYVERDGSVPAHGQQST